MSDCNAQDGHQDLRAQLLELYTRLAQEPDVNFGWGKGKENARQLGYAEAWLNQLPDCVWESASAVGNPFSLGAVQQGEIIVDIGCGAGADACVAALLVGEEGKVFGFDCTPAMVAKATANASASGLVQVVVQEADMTALPLPDNSVDVVISNGAVNLAADKDTVLREVFRILRPAGRLQIADMVRDPSSTDSSCCEKASWADCVSGTLHPEVFLDTLRSAGFIHTELPGSLRIAPHPVRLARCSGQSGRSERCSERATQRLTIMIRRVDLIPQLQVTSCVDNLA